MIDTATAVSEKPREKTRENHINDCQFDKLNACGIQKTANLRKLKNRRKAIDIINVIAYNINNVDITHLPSTMRVDIYDLTSPSTFYFLVRKPEFSLLP